MCWLAVMAMCRNTHVERQRQSRVTRASSLGNHPNFLSLNEVALYAEIKVHVKEEEEAREKEKKDEQKAVTKNLAKLALKRISTQSHYSDCRHQFTRKRGFC